MQHSKNLEEYILNTIDDIVFVVADDRIIYCNRNAKKYFKFKTGSFTCKNVENLWSEKEMELWKKFVNITALNGNFTTDYKEKDQYTYQIKMFRNNDFEASYSILIIIKDITENKKNVESIKTLNSEMYKFSGIVSHELKVPIRAMNIYSQNLAKEINGNVSSSAQEAMDYIGLCSRKLLNMIDELMAYSKINSGELNLENVDIEKEIIGTFNEFKIINSERKIELKLKKHQKFIAIYFWCVQ